MNQFIYILIREDDDDVRIVETASTPQQAWEHWKHHVRGAHANPFTNDDASRLLEWENLRSYRTANEKFSYRLQCVPLPA